MEPAHPSSTPPTPAVRRFRAALGTGPGVLDRTATLAATVLDAPIARVVLDPATVVGRHGPRDPGLGRSTISVALHDAHGETVGVLVVADRRARGWTARDRRLLGVLARAATAEVADVSAQARARRSIQRHADEQQLLARASAALQTGVEPAEELDALTRALVPGFADACSAILLDEPVPVGTPGVEVWGRRVAFATAPDPAAPDPARPDLDATVPGLSSRLTWGGSGLFSEVVAQGRPRSARVLGPTADAVRGAGLLGWLEAVGATTVAASPIVVDGAVVGMLVFASGPSRPPVSRADLAVMGRIATRAGAALGQGLAYVRQRDTSLALQRSMLTDAPVVGGLTVVVRYRPSAVDTEVGGDWYDAFALPGGDLAIAIGDVAGHDLAAAATMGQLRSMLRATTYDRDDEDPGAVLTRLDRAAVGLAVTDFTSALLGRLRVDPAVPPARRAVLSWSNAGHPPPVLVSPDGRAEILDGARGTVLGVLPDRARPTASATVSADSFLLLHTDGLVERRGRAEDVSILTVVAQAFARGDGTLEGFCDELIAAAPPVDDVAVLAVCVGS